MNPPKVQGGKPSTAEGITLSVKQRVRRRRLSGAASAEWCAEFDWPDGTVKSTGWLDRPKFLMEYVVLHRKFVACVMDGTQRAPLTTL